MNIFLSILFLALGWGLQPDTNNPWIDQIMQPQKEGIFRGIKFGMSEKEVRTTDPSPYVINKKGGSMSYSEALSPDFPPEQFGLAVTYYIDKASQSLFGIDVTATLRIDQKELDALVHDFGDYFTQMGGAPDEDDSGRIFDFEMDNDAHLTLPVVPKNAQGNAQIIMKFQGQPSDGPRDDAATGEFGDQ